MTGGALGGWRAVELADGQAAAFCGKLLADLGAEVVKVEPSGGHASRHSAPCRPVGVCAGFIYLNTGKSSVVLDSTPDGEERLRGLVAESDVVITDRDESDLVALGELPPSVVMTSIRPFGSTGPYASYAANHLTVFHAGGEGAILPSGPGWEMFPDRAPIQLGSEIAYYDAGWTAAVAVLAACYDVRRSGQAQHVDVSIQESQLTLNRTRLSRFNNDGIVLRRGGSRYGIGGMLRCDDGWVQLAGIRDEHWDRLIASSEQSEFRDERFATPQARAANRPALGDALALWCAARSKFDVVRVMSTIGAPAGIYAVPSDLLGSGQLAQRGFFQDVDDGRGGDDHPAGRALPPLADARRASSCADDRILRLLPFSQGRASVDRRRRRTDARGHPCPRLHMGSSGAVRHAAARLPRRRGDQGRVHSPT